MKNWSCGFVFAFDNNQLTSDPPEEQQMVPILGGDSALEPGQTRLYDNGCADDQDGHYLPESQGLVEKPNGQKSCNHGFEKK